MPRKRRTAVDDLRALAGGGIDALRVAEELTRTDDYLQVRCSKARKAIYAAAAKRAGAKSLSAWVISVLDSAARKEDGR